MGYLTGLSIYNKLGLTSQVGSVIQIGKQDVRASFKRGRYRISFVKQKNVITKENITSLQLLDAFRYIKKIPDSDIKNSCKTLEHLISKLSEKELNSLVRLALKYQPSTRALLGAILTDLGKGTITEKLTKSLNPLTSYTLPGITDVCLTAKGWNFKK